MWLTLLGTVALIALAGLLIYTKATEVASWANTSENSVHIAAYVTWGVDALLVCVIFCSRKSIAIAASILETAALFLADVKSAMLLPLVSAFLQIIVLAGFSILAANAASVGIKQVTGSDITDHGTCTFSDGAFDPFYVKFENKTQSYMVVIFLILMYFWSASLLHAFNTYTVAYAAGVWYFSPYDDNNMKDLPGGNTFCDFKLLWRGFCAGIKQLGSLALGAMVMAICKLILLLSRCFKKKEETEHTNPASKCLASM